MRFRLLLAANRLVLALVLFHFLPNLLGAPQRPEPRTPEEMAAAADTNDAVIAQITADRLTAWNYSQHPFDAEISSRFLDRYLDSLDYFHMFFLQSDIDEFEQYRTNLNVLTLQKKDITPCWIMFSRFMERVHQRVDFASNLLETAKFDFTNQERFVLNRHKLPYPKNVDEAREFWRQEARSLYLDQLLTSSDVQFAGQMHFDDKSNALVTLTSDKNRQLTFDLLPAQFLAKDGHAMGRLEVAANQTNAILHLDLPWSENLRKTTNILYSAKGEELGDVTFRRVRTETNETVKFEHNDKGELITETNATVRIEPNNKSDLISAPPVPLATNWEAVIHLNEKNLSEIHKTLTNRYAQMLRNYKTVVETDRGFELYVNSLARAFDPHSDFMGHMSAEDFAIQMRLSLFGIGALLGQDNDYCRIEELKEGPAKKSGKLNVHDRIVAVAQSNSEPVDVVGMPVPKIVEMIRGPKGSEVTLTLLPVGEADPSVHKEVTLIRDEIKLEDQETKAYLYETTDASGSPSRIGVINIPSFYADTDRSLSGKDGASHPKSMTADVARLIKRLKEEKVGGIILDLRRNGGGYLEEARELTGLFVKPGPVVQTKDPTGEINTEFCRRSKPAYDGPLIVLTSRFSASASEILAGALQDYNRALIVGDHSTFGKGTVQTMQPLQPYLDQYLKHKGLAYDPNYDPGEIKITIKKFYRAGGVSTQLKGVVSDIELPSILNYETNEVGESSLPYALPCDEVTSADPENLNRVKPYLAELLERSRERVATNKDFVYIQEDITEFLKQQADKSISLNLAERQADQKTRTARADAIKKERASRKKSNEKVFDVTLQNVDKPELELQTVKTTTVATADVPAFEDDDPDADSALPAGAIDPELNEARHIMTDYIALVNKEPVISKVP
jgi:carboxyl-terminal processing protease